MRRSPLRPLAHIISARQEGKNPDFIEAKERSKRNQVLQLKTRVRAENRLLALGLIFIIGFSAVGGKMAMLASSSSDEVKQYIRWIGNRRLTQLGLDPIYKIEANPLPWLDTMLNAVEHMNFFEGRATEYSKASTKGNWAVAFS